MTGAGGFVGGHLVDFLHAEEPGVEIHGVVLPHGGVSWRAAAGARVVEADLNDPAAAAAVVEDVRPERILHLAGQSSVHNSWLDPGGTLRTNVLGIVHLLDAVRRQGRRPAVLVVGSAEEYGPVGPEEMPIREETPLRPASPYAVSKVAQGALALLYGPAGGLRVVLTRTFHHTGPGRGEAFAESSFARQIAEIEAGLRPPVLKVGNLDAVRDFADVRDVVRAYWQLLEKGEGGTAYNVCSGTGRPVRQLLDMLLAASSARVEVKRGSRPASPLRRARAGRRPVPPARGHGLGAEDPPRAHPARPARRLEGSDRHRCARAMKVLLTGATGFLGRTVARHLAARGHALRVLARPTSRLEGLPEGVEVAAGDVTDALSMTCAAEGCGAVVHMAALVKIWVPDPERFETVNVGGLVNALAAARAAGARLVYTSSFMALGPSGAGALDAERPHCGPPFRNLYERTKARADALAREAVAGGQDVVTLYPGVIYGPGDMTEGNIVVRMIADHLNGRLPALVGPGDRRWSYAFVEDVAEGHALALEKGRPGDRFVLGGENATLARVFDLVQEITAAPPPRHRIPYGVASAIGRAQWLWAETTGHPPQLTHGEVGVFREEWACDSARAEREIGYDWRPLAEGLRETVRWLRAQGLAPSARSAS